MKIKKQKQIKFKFQTYKNCLEALQLENRINYLEKIKIDIDSINEFIKRICKKQ